MKKTGNITKMSEKANGHCIASPPKEVRLNARTVKIVLKKLRQRPLASQLDRFCIIETPFIAKRTCVKKKVVLFYFLASNIFEEEPL